MWYSKGDLRQDDVRGTSGGRNLRHISRAASVEAILVLQICFIESISPCRSSDLPVSFEASHLFGWRPAGHYAIFLAWWSFECPVAYWVQFYLAQQAIIDVFFFCSQGPVTCCNNRMLMRLGRIPPSCSLYHYHYKFIATDTGFVILRC